MRAENVRPARRDSHGTSGAAAAVAIAPDGTATYSGGALDAGSAGAAPDGTATYAAGAVPTVDVDPEAESETAVEAQARSHVRAKYRAGAVLQREAREPVGDLSEGVDEHDASQDRYKVG